MRVRVAPARDDLEDKDAVAEDVRFGREDTMQGILRRHVPAAFQKHTAHREDVQQSAWIRRNAFRRFFVLTKTGGARAPAAIY